MPAIIEDDNIARCGLLNQMRAKRRFNPGAGRIGVQDKRNVLLGKAKFVDEKLAHRRHVIDAAMQSIWRGILVNPD